MVDFPAAAGFGANTDKIRKSDTNLVTAAAAPNAFITVQRGWRELARHGENAMLIVR